MSKDKKIYEEYINGLETKYLHSDDILKEKYNSFIQNKKGISDDELKSLLKEFNDIPDSLVELLKYSNGTKIYCFQSDVDNGKYPYYLIDSTEMIAAKDDAKKYYSDYIEREFDDVEIDGKITTNIDNVEWLLFANCMNNGGTSQLFIDFTPSKEGKVGQIVRYLHDPDSIIVIADSFDDFLKQIMDSNYRFVDGEMETNEWLKTHPQVKVKQKTKNKLSPVGILLFGIISILIGTIGFATSRFFIGVIMLLFGVICIIVSIAQLKGKKKQI
ncbi:MAG: SMI1/KNR4 family protein [Bacilli bacterium]